jgi:hypothetical protein
VKIFLKVLIISGNFITLFGLVLLVLAAFDFYKMEVFSFGLSSGIRIVGSILICGCLLSATGYSFYEYIENNT